MVFRIVLVLASFAAMSACSGSDGAQGPQGEPGEPGEPGEGVALGYVGSEACGECHAAQYAGWTNSGHPYKIVAVDDILNDTAYPAFVNDIHGEYDAVDANFFEQAGADLLSINENTFPEGGWDDVTYVIGGYGWKTRFINVDGYIITGTDNGGTESDKVQYNFPLDVDAFGEFAYEDLDASSSTYHTGEMKPYDCGTCHTTGWVADTDAADDDDLSDNQDMLPGIHGTWEEPGVGCEGCHGPSAGHQENPYEVRTPADPAASCGNCHIRTDPYEIDTSGGFIRHHEQFEELIEGKHSALGCVGCHDPHQPVRFGDQYEALDGEDDDPNPDFPNFHGVRVDCTSCHFNETAAYDLWAENIPGMGGVSCENCHMPKATKSAVKAGVFYGDTATHLFGINTWVDPVLNPEETTTGSNPANPYISLDWSCGACHFDEAESSPDFYDWAFTAVQSFGGVHGNGQQISLPIPN